MKRSFVGPAALLAARHRYRRCEGLAEESRESLEATYLLAQALTAQGDHEAARKLLAYLHESKRSRPLDSLAISSTYALVLSHLGSLEEARRLQVATLDSLTKRLGSQHTRSLTERHGDASKPPICIGSSCPLGATTWP